MANIITRPGWHISERLVTPEAAFLNRRRFLKQLGFAGAGWMSASLVGCSKAESKAEETPANTNAASAKPVAGYPAPRNPEFNPGWPLSDEKTAATYNNFYEFSTVKDRVHKLTDKFITAPWPIQIGGLVEHPIDLDVQELIGMMTLDQPVHPLRRVGA